MSSKECEEQLKELIYDWETEGLLTKIYATDIEAIKHLMLENQELKERICKAIKYISSNDIEVLKYHDIPSETTSYEIVTVDLLKILRGY